MIAENFSNLGKETHIQVQEAQRVPTKMNLKRPTPRHIIIKMAKIKEKGLKVSRKKALALNNTLYKINRKPYI